MVTSVNIAAFTSEYRTEFSITGPDETETPLFQRVCDTVQAWFGQLLHGGEPVWESGEFEALAYRRVQMELPHSGVPDLRLLLELNLSTGRGPVAARIESRFLEDGANPPPPSLLPGPPSLVAELFREFECRRGADRLSSDPVTITPETASSFADNRIFNLDRELPIIAVSQDWRRAVPISPNRLQRMMAGLAEVVTYDDSAAEELRNCVGFQLACYGGAIRIYQPGCAREDRRGQHPFWMPAQARALGEQSAGSLVREFSRYLPEVPNTREFENVRSQVQQGRRAELAAERLARPLRKRVKELEDEIASLRQELRKREQDTATREENLRNLHSQLLDRDSDLDDLRARLEQAIRLEAERQPEIARLRQQQAERDDRIESLRQQLESAIGQAGAGQSQVAQLHSQLLERDTQVEALRGELGRAANRAAEAEQEFELLHIQIRESDEQVESLRQQLEDAAGQEGVSQAAIAQLTSSLQERDDELGALRAHLESALNRSAEISGLIAELNEELEIRDADITNLRSLLEGVEEGSADSEAIIAELRKERQEREDDARAISDLLEKARHRADAAESAAAELRRELERHIAESDAISNIIRENGDSVAETLAGDAETDGLIAELRQQIEAHNSEIAELKKQWEDTELNYQIGYEDQEKKIKDQERRISYLEYELDRYRSKSDEPEHYEEPLEFGSVFGAVEVARQNFDKLRFLDSAFETANGCPYRRPDVVYQAFDLLQQLATARSEGPIGMSVEDWMREQGCDYALHESEATMNLYGRTRWFGGIEMQEHIKIGGGTSDRQHYLRIHFAWQEQELRYVIGYVGEHLPIANH